MSHSSKLQDNLTRCARKITITDNITENESVTNEKFITNAKLRNEKQK